MTTVAPSSHRAAKLDDPSRGLTRRRVLLWCIGCAPVFMGVVFGAMLLAGWVPPPSPGQSAAEVQAMYLEHTDLKRVAFTLMLIGAGLSAPVFVAISSQLDRIPGARPLSVLQIIGGVIGIVALVVPALLFLGAAFRPERPPEITQALHDTGMIMFLGTFVAGAVQTSAIGVAVLMQRGPDDVLPRWFGYLNLWVALAFLPAAFLYFFRSGALAWNGAICFWLVAAVTGVWIWVGWAVIRRAISEEPA